MRPDPSLRIKAWPWLVAAMAAAAQAAAPSTSALAFDIAYDPAVGEPLYNARCAACHDHPSGRTPAKGVIANNTPPYIFGALNDGVMRANAEGLSRGEKFSIAMYLSQNKAGGTVSRLSSETPRCTHSPGPLTLSGHQWNGWGGTVENRRYQPDPGFTALDVARLKLKWAMAMSGNRSGHPVIAAGRLF